MLLQLGQKRRDLFSRQPTERSSEPPEEDDDTGLVFPQLLKGCFLLGDSVGQFHASNTSRIHGDNGLKRRAGLRFVMVLLYHAVRELS